MTYKTLGFSVLLLCVGLFVSCSGVDATLSESGNATVRVHLTDAPSDYIESAEVSISSVQLLQSSDGEDADRIELLDEADSPMTFDLLDLRNGVEAFLAERPVPAGEYGQIRMIVGDAVVTLVDGYTFEDGSITRTLKVPSGAQSGIKVALDGVIDADEGMVTVVVVDFDVNESFVMQGNPETPAGIKGILFTPVLKEEKRSGHEMI